MHDPFKNFTRETEVRPQGKLTYAFTDDWFIFAEDEAGKQFAVNTELWSEWADLHTNADREPNAVEKYMLPVAQRKWNSLPWKFAG